MNLYIGVSQVVLFLLEPREQRSSSVILRQKNAHEVGSLHYTPQGLFSSSRASVLLQSRECSDGLSVDVVVACLRPEESPLGRKELNVLGATLASCDHLLLGLLSPLLSVNAEKR